MTRPEPAPALGFATAPVWWPLIAIGSGLAACAVRLARRDTPARVQAMVAHAAGYTAGALLLLAAAKSLAYGVSMSSFRGDPVVFSARFVEDPA